MSDTNSQDCFMMNEVLQAEVTDFLIVLTAYPEEVALSFQMIRMFKQSRHNSNRAFGF